MDAKTADKSVMLQQMLTDHYRNPRNRGIVEHSDKMVKNYNSACGDLVSFSVLFSGDRIQDIKFEGKGCVISQATASLLTEAIKGMTKDQVRALDKEFISRLVQLPLGPTRLRCALLSLEAVKKLVE